MSLPGFNIWLVILLIFLEKEGVIFNFEQDSTGQLPHRWTVVCGDWKVAEEDTNHFITQVSKRKNRDYSIATIDSLLYRDFRCSAKMKFIGGENVQGGGIIWRYQDEKNYYVLWANPLNRSIIQYRVKNGHRVELPLLGKREYPGAFVRFSLNTWYTIGLQAEDNTFKVYLNDKEIFREEDKTFQGEGKVGLWIKGDAKTYFDDITIEKL
jgi:hypothetical protein